jgi:hypothetical protein
MLSIGMIPPQPRINAENILWRRTYQSPKKGKQNISLANTKHPKSELSLQMRFGKVGNDAQKAFYPFPPFKEKLITMFLNLIYDGKSIMADKSKETFR